MHSAGQRIDTDSRLTVIGAGSILRYLWWPRPLPSTIKAMWSGIPTRRLKGTRSGIPGPQTRFRIVLVRSPRTQRTRTGPVPNQQRTIETPAITWASFALASASSRLSASLQPANGLTALTTRSVERRNGAYVMAGTESIMSGCRDAQGANHSRRTTDGSQDGSGVSWLQLLDVARPRAERTRSRRSDPQPEST